MRSVAGLLIAAVFLGMPAPLVAQDACVGDGPEPEALQLTPAPGGSAPATIDSPVLARFAPDVEVADFTPAMLLTVFAVMGDGTVSPVDGDYAREAAQPNVLIFRAADGLEPGLRYRVDVFDPVDDSERMFVFETGEGGDQAPPYFDPSADLTLRAAQRGADCRGTRVDAVFQPALDDGPRGSVEHLVYQTRGAELEAPVLRGRVRASMGSEVSTSFVLDSDEASDPVCVLVLPVDGAGRVGEPLGPRCFAPDGRARFVGLCASHPVPVRGVRWLLVWVGLALALGWRRLQGHERP